MRPLAAMGDVCRWTPPQSPVPPLKRTDPVSPSNALSLAPFMNHTMAFDLPSVVVEMGERRRTSSSSPTLAHHAMRGVGGDPGWIVMPMTLLFATPFGQTEPMVVLMAR